MAKEDDDSEMFATPLSTIRSQESTVVENIERSLTQKIVATSKSIINKRKREVTYTKKKLLVPDQSTQESRISDKSTLNEEKLLRLLDIHHTQSTTSSQAKVPQHPSRVIHLNDYLSPKQSSAGFNNDNQQPSSSSIRKTSAHQAAARSLNQMSSTRPPRSAHDTMRSKLSLESIDFYQSSPSTSRANSRNSSRASSRVGISHSSRSSKEESEEEEQAAGAAGLAPVESTHRKKKDTTAHIKHKKPHGSKLAASHKTPTHDSSKTPTHDSSKTPDSSPSHSIDSLATTDHPWKKHFHKVRKYGLKKKGAKAKKKKH